MKETEIILLEAAASKKQWRVSCHDLWQDIFGDSDAYMEYYERFKWQDNRVFLLTQGDRLCSMLHLNPYRIRQGNLERELHYIVGVCTSRELRRRGYMAVLLREAFQYLYDRGEPWTYLMPAAPAIYEAFGFRPVSQAEPREVCFCRVADMREEGREFCCEGCADERGRVFSYEGCSDEEREALVRFAGACLSERFRIYAVHDRSYFEEISEELKACGGELLIMEQGGEIIGYTEYMYDGSEEIPMEAAETVFADGKQETGCRMMEEYLSGRYGTETLRALFTESAFLPEYRFGMEGGSGKGTRFGKRYPVKCQIMARVLNIQAAARSMHRPDHWGERVCFQITDPFLEENNGRWELCFGEEENIVRRTQDHPAFCLEIGEFTEIFFQGSPLYINDMV